jgi:hypothetical protein
MMHGEKGESESANANGALGKREISSELPAQKSPSTFAS